MTDVRTETVPLVDGSALRLTVAEPPGAVRGGIVVLHEARGVTETVRRLVRGLAADGWLAVAPHLYHRDGADEIDGADEEITARAGRLSEDEVMADTDTAFGWLAERDIDADRMGVLGFDTGGAVALLVAAQRRLGAAVSVTGEPHTGQVADLDALTKAAPGLTCPWLGIYGETADGDGTPDGSVVDRLRDAASTAETVTDVVVYPRSGHRFDADPDAAAEAWQRALNWFDAHLR